MYCIPRLFCVVWNFTANIDGWISIEWENLSKVKFSRTVQWFGLQSIQQIILESYGFRCSGKCLRKSHFLLQTNIYRKTIAYLHRFHFPMTLQKTIALFTQTKTLSEVILMPLQRKQNRTQTEYNANSRDYVQLFFKYLRMHFVSNTLTGL